MPLKNKAIQILVRPRVLHSLSGRLRVHIPLLKAAVKENPHLVDTISELITIIPGIKSFNCTGVTGNALVTYDPLLIHEKKLLKYLYSCAILYINSKDKFDIPDPQKMPLAIAQLKEWLSNAISNNDLNAFPEEIPANVLS